MSLCRVLTYALIVGQYLALGRPHDETGFIIIKEEAPMEKKEFDAFKFDTPPLIPNESKTNGIQEKGYNKPVTTRRLLTMKHQTERKVAAPAQTARKIRVDKRKNDSWRHANTEPNFQVRRRKEVADERGAFDPASSIMAAVEQTKRKIAPQSSRDKVSKGYVKPSTKSGAKYQDKKKTQTQRKFDQSILKPVQATKRLAGPPAPPPPPPSSSRKYGNRKQSQAVAAKPAVLAHASTPRSPIGAASTRRVITSKAPQGGGNKTSRQADRRDRRPIRIAEEEITTSTSIEEIIPARTVRKVAQPKKRAVKMPVKKARGHKQQRVVYSEESTEESEEVLSSSSEEPVRARKGKKHPARPAATSRKIIKGKKSAKPARSSKPKKKDVLESDLDDSTTTTSFERQFTRRKIGNESKKKPSTKKRKVSSSTESTESEEEEDSSTNEESEPSSSSSSSSTYVQTRRGKTQRKVVAPRKREARKAPIRSQGNVKKKKPVREETTYESDESLYQKKPQKTKRRVKVEQTRRKVETTKRNIETPKKRDRVKKKPTRNQGRKQKGRYETTSEESEESTSEESSSYRPAAISRKAKRTPYASRRR